jgi:nucleotide-binding universal stress UspA family protein
VILICYDGSADAQAAIDHAGELLGAQPATVLAVWEPFVSVLARSGAGIGGGAIADVDEIDRASEQTARDAAEQGAERARRAGLDAQPRTRARDTTIAEAILEEADAVGAGAVVLGTRGLSGLKSLLLGSVSHAVLQHADRTVVVAPSAELAAKRASERR